MPGQLSLFDPPSHAAADTGRTRSGLIDLAGRFAEYRLARTRRRTLGIIIDAEGLSIRAPLRMPWREIEAFVRDHERWIVGKLDEWARSPRRRYLLGTDGEALPLFGAPVRLAVREGPGAVRHEAGERLAVYVPEPRRRVLVLAQLAHWLKRRAIEALAPRAAHYAAQLALAPPQVALSSARTQWGVCLAGGRIRLSWRLVHLDPALADYVVAHEVAHMIEMNHSRRFWYRVETLYPGWREARERLELAGASLPIIRGVH